MRVMVDAFAAGDGSFVRHCRSAGNMDYLRVRKSEMPEGTAGIFF